MRTAANGGCADSATRLGVCYLHGNGVKLDQVQAAAWLTQGSQDGAANPFATFSLGQMHENGHGGFACNPCRALDFY
jgi:TPR repeat protein